MSSADPKGVSELRRAVEDLLAEGAVQNVPDEEAGRLLAAAVSLYAAKREAGMELGSFPGATATGVVVTVTDLLKAVDVELFELGMWQVWGRP